MLIVTVDLEEWISLHEDASVWVLGVGFKDGVVPGFISRYPFQFGVILVFRYRLNVTFVSCNVNLFFISKGMLYYGKKDGKSNSLHQRRIDGTDGKWRGVKEICWDPLVIWPP